MRRTGLPEQSGRDERLGDAINKARTIVQDSQDRFARLHGPDIAQRYLKRDGRLYVHFSLSRGGRQAKNLCYTVQWIGLRGREIVDDGAEEGGDPFGVQVSEGIGTDCEVELSNGAHDRNQEPVLIYIVQRNERPKKIVPSLVRLQRPVDVHYSLPSGLYYSRALGFVEVLPGIVHPELIKPVLATSTSWEHEQVPEDVERRAEIVNGIASNGAPNREAAAQGRLHTK